MSFRPRIALALLVTAAPAAMGAFQSAPAESPFSGPIVEQTSPAPEASAQPNLTSDRQGRVWLSWLETTPERGHRFRLSALQASGWAAPATIAEGTQFFANWADFPSIFTTSSGVLAAHWLERSGAGTYAYGVRVRTSKDGGRTWSAPVTPHRDNSPQEHGFVSFFEAPGGELGVVWLDGREMTAGHGAAPAAGGHGTGSMTLRATTLRDGKLGEEMLVDSRVCECCQTSAARIDGGAIVAYRDRSDREVRDIAVSRFVNGAWSTPTLVHADNWEINACPVNGPAIAASGRAVAVAWYTLAGGAPRAKLAFSSDGGATFGAPIVLNQDPTYGRLGIAMLDADRVLVSGIERGESGAHLVVREVRRDGRISVPMQVAPATSDRSSGFPRLVVTGRRVVFAWTEVKSGTPPAAGSRPVTRVRVATATLK